MNSAGGFHQTVPLKDALRALELLAERYPPQSKTVHVASVAPGRILAEDVEADSDIPPRRTSSVNGIATMVSHVGNTRRIVGLSTAFSPFHATISSGECVRITCGGVVPDGADTVVPCDDVILRGEEGVEIQYPSERGANIRELGSEAKQGDVLLKDGSKIDSLAIGLLNSLGIALIDIYRKPRVCVVSIKNRLDNEEKTKRRRRRDDVIRPQLLALFQAQGFKAIDAGSEAEKTSRIEKSLKVAANFACVIVVVGGNEALRNVVEALDLTMDIDRIDCNPGNYSFAHGNIEGKPVFLCMLPADLSSALIGAHLFVSPMLRAMEGRIVRSSLRFKAKLLDPIPKCSKTQFMRARCESSDGLLVAKIVNSDSILGANAILEISPDSDDFEVLLFESLPLSAF